MKVTLKNNTLIIEAPINTPLTPSKSLKNLNVFSSHGNVRTTALVDGKPVTIGLNAYITP